MLEVAGHREELPLLQPQDLQVREPGQVPLATLEAYPALALLLAGAALCNDASLQTDDNAEGHLQTVGDPTETALVMAAARFGLEKTTLEQTLPRVAEVPFDSERKRMTTMHKSPSPRKLPPILETAWPTDRGIEEMQYVVFTKGAVDSLLEISKALWVRGRCEPLDTEWHRRMSSANDQLAQTRHARPGRGLSVPAVASGA